MALFNRRIFGFLEKPLDLTTKLFFGLAKGTGSASHAGSKDGLYKPSPSTHSPITSNPLVPAFLLLLVGFLILYSTPVQTWLTETEGLPSLAEIFSFSSKPKPQVLSKQGETVGVWARSQSGFYYCQGGTLFGNAPGAMMSQVDALTSGYRPSGGEYCAGGQQIMAASGDQTLETQQPEQASMSTPLEESFNPALATPSDVSNTAAGIKVWAIKSLGSYYCRGQILFGSRQGKLMSQSDAISAGYRPSVSPCAASATASTLEADSHGMLSTKPAAQPNPEGEVQVWVKREFGFYYCRNDVLFGRRPGHLMTQSSALAAGYHPSDGHCTDGNPTPAPKRLPAHGLSDKK